MIPPEVAAPSAAFCISVNSITAWRGYLAGFFTGSAVANAVLAWARYADAVGVCSG